MLILLIDYRHCPSWIHGSRCFGHSQSFPSRQYCCTIPLSSGMLSGTNPCLTSITCAKEFCDDKLITIMNDKQQARYLVKHPTGSLSYVPRSSLAAIFTGINSWIRYSFRSAGPHECWPSWQIIATAILESRPWRCFGHSQCFPFGWFPRWALWIVGEDHHQGFVIQLWQMYYGSQHSRWVVHRYLVSWYRSLVPLLIFIFESAVGVDIWNY